MIVLQKGLRRWLFVWVVARLRFQVGVRGLVDNVLPLAFAVLLAMLVFSVQGRQHLRFIGHASNGLVFA